MNAIQAFARERDGENLLKCIEAGVPVSLKDSKGQTALHWAVDRGHLNIIELLVAKNADVNAKENEGQGPLHYAAVCDREAIAKFLVKQNARTDMKDNDGNTPYDLCDMKWPWLQNAVA
ncbi:Acyl-CoA-binding domain-containing protein 1 [Sarracenia purpurea var. burkii]